MNLNVEYYPKLLEKKKQIYNAQIEKNKSNWDDPFFIDTSSYLDFEEIQEKTKHFDQQKIENLIVLGTGGSIQTLLALKHLAKKRIYSLMNSRTIELRECLRNTDPSNSLVIPISRGGETLDINSTIGMFEKKGYPMLGLSSQGTMYSILNKMGAPLLDVPDLSGRFAGSISNVAIVPAMLSGIDVHQFLNGLREAYDVFMSSNISLAKEFASFIYALYNIGFGTVFSMPYSLTLEGTVGLFVQEISESTGKDKKGMIGTYQSAPLCQHSVVEYLLGGKEKIALPVLWIVENEENPLILDSPIEFINGNSAHKIINYQAAATFQALIEEGIPSAMISVDNTNEKSIGNLVGFIQATVYYLCLLLDVNWANNPKVVIGKKICNEALINQKGFDELKERRSKIASESFKNYF
jgi:glucose-6-phosphate isomerase